MRNERAFQRNGGMLRRRSALTGRDVEDIFREHRDGAALSDLPDRIHLTNLGRAHFDDPALREQMPGAPDGVTYWDVLLAWERSALDAPRSAVTTLAEEIAIERRGMSREAQMRRWGWAP